MEPGGIVELRVPNAGFDGTISGYFADTEKLIQAAVAVNGKGPGVYVTINRIKTDLLARAANRTQARAKNTTGDDDVLRRRWLLLDFDPRRPSGISSTEAEHDAALQVAHSAKETLDILGWPVPILADSGNGGHLLYSIDLPSKESTDLLKGLLKAASVKFGTPAVEVDVSVFNASRISKLYGTVAAKGDSTPDRPHRLSRMLDIPDTLEPVSLELLEAFAGKPEPQQQRATSHSTNFNLVDWISRHGIQIERGPVPDNGSDKWVLKACPFNPDHKAPDAALFRNPSGALIFKCFHASCADKKWQDFRAVYEPESVNRQGFTAGAKWAEKPQVKPQVNNHAAQPAGPQSNVDIDLDPEHAPEPAGSNKPQSILERADSLLVAAIESKEPMLVLGVGIEPSDLIIALAQCGDIFARVARGKISKAFNSRDVPLREFDARLKKAVADLRPAASATPYLLTSEGGMLCNLANAITMLQAVPLRYNSFTCRLFLETPSPWGTHGDWTDYDDVKAAEWCQRQNLNISRVIAADAADAVGRQRPAYHPVIEYWKTIEWDEIPRLDHWLSDYLGIDDTPYTRAVASKWLMSACKRIVDPNTPGERGEHWNQADYTLVLEGDQGKQKSTALRALCPKWFSDDIGKEPGTPDAAMGLQGKLIVEIAELSAFRKSDWETIKAWLVRREDHFRRPYGRRSEDFPRQNVFAASTNKHDWLTDDTGGRRFWPVRVGTLNVEGLAAARDQLWAEALHRFMSGEATYLTDDLERTASEHQLDRQEKDIWTDTIEKWIQNPLPRQAGADIRSERGKIFVNDVLSQCMDIEEKSAGNPQRGRICRVLRLAGYVNKRETPTEAKDLGHTKRLEYWEPKCQDPQDPSGSFL